MDRNQDETSAGSLAIICITVSYADDSAMLGVWHSASLGKPGDEIPCAVSLDDGGVVARNCKVAPSRFGKGQIILSDDKAEIGRILRHKKLTVRLDEKGGKPKPLEFDLDTGALRKAEKEVYDFF